MTPIAYQLLDDKSTDRAIADFVSFDGEPLKAEQFLIIECITGRKFLGRILGAQLNLNRDGLSPLDSTSLSQLDWIVTGRMSRDAAIKEVSLYKVQFLKDISNGLSSVLVRPRMGAAARPATDDEIIECLKLPEKQEERCVGHIVNTSVPLCISPKVVSNHTLIAGASGSGKTNTTANYIKACASSGMFNIVFDHKPDYQHAHIKNDEGMQEYFEQLNDVAYFGVGRDIGINGSEVAISIRSMDIENGILAGSLFYRDSEEVQRECCELLLDAFSTKKKEEEDRPWTIQQFADHTVSVVKPSVAMNSNVYSAIQRKIIKRVPEWLDACHKRKKEGSSGFGNLVGLRRDDYEYDYFDIGSLIEPGRTLIIRIGSDIGDGRSYGLLLSYLLKQLYQLAEAHKIPCPVNLVIDEAQDIFCAGRAFKQVAEEMMEKYIRKMRSKRIGFTICVQAADSVPERIINNLNSRIVHRHNSYEQVRIAANRATEEQRKLTSTFGSGEALVDLFGSSGIVHAQMRMSPFKLTKEDIE